MSSTWSHLTCPPQPPFPVPISDDVFLPIPTPVSLRASFSEPSLSFDLKGLNMLASTEGEKEVVKIQEIKMRRRNTLLMTPGEVHKLATISILPPHQIRSSTKKPVFANKGNLYKPLPKTPQPARRIPSDISTPSSTHSDRDAHSEDDVDSESGSESEDESCASASASTHSTPYSSYIKHDDSLDVSPCPSKPNSKMDIENLLIAPIGLKGLVQIEGLPLHRHEREDSFRIWRSPVKSQSQIQNQDQHRSSAALARDEENAHNDTKVKRRRISQIEWEGMPCPEEFVSPKTKYRMNELGRSLQWTTLH
ncbi:uncharacterized protein I303_102183 [Kwoniella dejecticola CBS 10117]|uniref:Uncharacterized protein n=1 Tax=Kwoniella dejecticola CBS 10117 TaxID=1296121 RepID=A0A1A6ABM8_9TREE|nr:uncharacterized protein I303_01677 [Kwoniella dejecticola CBS 10117]OBR87472.1 hypothetical protein I303_01677 [Kwoniella dejecticola CBS 10117]